MKKLLLIFLASFVLISCEVQDPEFVKIKNFKIKTINPYVRTVTINYRPVIHNPNSIPFAVSKVETQIYFDETHMGDAVSEDRIVLKAQEDSEFNIAQNIKVESLLKKLKTFTQKDSIKIQIDGKYTFKAGEKELVIPHVFETYLNPKEEFAGFLFNR